jgi:hypothetical protein
VAGLPGSRFYAVNDRPVAIVPAADGGADCLVFDFATGEMIPDRSYFGYVTPGSGKDVDELTDAEFDDRVARYRAEAGGRAAAKLRDWAEQLCTVTGGAAAAAAALGLTPPDRAGAVMTPDLPPGFLRVSVAPAGTSRPLARVQPAGRLLTRAILDACFGAGRELPVLPDSWDEGHVAYQVSVPGVPARCSVVVRIRDGAAAQISLRRG